MMLHGIDQQSRGLLNDYHRQAKESEPISPVKTESCPWQMQLYVELSTPNMGGRSHPRSSRIVSVHLSVRGASIFETWFDCHPQDSDNDIFAQTPRPSRYPLQNQQISPVAHVIFLWVNRTSTAQELPLGAVSPRPGGLGMVGFLYILPLIH